MFVGEIFSTNGPHTTRVVSVLKKDDWHHFRVESKTTIESIWNGTEWLSRPEYEKWLVLMKRRAERTRRKKWMS